MAVPVVERGASIEQLPPVRLHDGTVMAGKKRELVLLLLDGHRTRDTAVPADLIDKHFFPDDAPAVARVRTRALIAGTRNDIPHSSGVVIPTVDDSELKRKRGVNRASVFIYVPDQHASYYEKFIAQPRAEEQVSAASASPNGEVVFSSGSLKSPAGAIQDRRAVQYTPFVPQPKPPAPPASKIAERVLSEAEKREKEKKRGIGDPPYVSPEQWETAEKWDASMLAWLERRVPDTLQTVSYEVVPGGRMISYITAVATGNLASFDPNTDVTTFYNYKFESSVCRSLLKKNPSIMSLARLFRAVQKYAETHGWERNFELRPTG